MTYPRPLIGQVLILIITGLAFSSLAYYIEQGEDSGFTDIPTAFYWVIITMTTVGWGQIFKNCIMRVSMFARVQIRRHLPRERSGQICGHILRHQRRPDHVPAPAHHRQQL